MNSFEAALGGMADLPQWFVWRLEWIAAAEQKYRKTPCAHDGSVYRIDASQPANWSDFDTVRNVVARLDTPGAAVRYAMGFWLTSSCGYFLFDLDNALGPEGQWLPLAHEFCAAYAGAMVERSSSGRGLHVIGSVDSIPQHRSKPGRDVASRIAPLAIELYTEGRGIAFGLDGHANGCADTRFDLAPLVARFFAPSVVSAERAATGGGFQGSDDELIAKALAVRDSAAVAFGGRASFADLWHGRTPKDSEHDAALAARLAWWTASDEERVERLMRQSALKRAKWNERRGGGTYLSETVANACQVVTGAYQEPQRAASCPTAGDDGTASATSDLANARRLVATAGRDLMHVPGLGWHAWGASGPWTADEGQAQRMAFALGKVVQAEADALEPWVNDETINGSDEQKRRADHQKSLHRWARTCEFVVSVRHTLEAAAPLFTVRADALDSDPLLVGTPSGVIDLRTGTQREHRREDRITKRIACDLDPQAVAPLWAAFVSRIMGGDAQLAAYLQTLCGYALSGHRGEHALPVFYGSGANGKSTFLATIQALMGDYAGTASPGLLLARKDSDQLAAIAALRGLRLVVVSESGETERLDESRVKQITGGDRLTGRALYSNFIEFDPTHLAVLQTNHRPRVNGTDDGIWRRLRLVPFAVTVPASERDPQLLQKLRAELPGILAWCVEGWRMYQAHGFREPEAVRMATAEYRSASDIIGQFLGEACATGPALSVPSAALYQHFARWSELNGERPMTQKTFSLRLEERPGLAKAKTEHGMVWRGVGMPLASPPGLRLVK